MLNVIFTHLFTLLCGIGFAMQGYHPSRKLPEALGVSDFQLELNSLTNNRLDSGSDQHLAYISAPNSGIDQSSLHEGRPSIFKFRFIIVSDLDQFSSGKIVLGDPNSKVWVSFLKQGTFIVEESQSEPGKLNASVSWDTKKSRRILSEYNYGGRGMEMSTLNVFQGKLYACDDKTGIFFHLQGFEEDDASDIVPTPFVILGNLANSSTSKGFQCEWATVKDGELWVGSHGINESNENGEPILTGTNPKKFVKRVTPDGIVTTLDWSKNFDKMSHALNVPAQGYVRHECGLWSELLQKWIFMPRRVSKQKFDPYSFARSGSNAVIFADQKFKNIKVQHIGEFIPSQGFTDSKLVPGIADHVILAIKVVETEYATESYLTAFDLNGNVLLNPTKFADQKYEGLEFL